jgi:hypothetical protein
MRASVIHLVRWLNEIKSSRFFQKVLSPPCGVSWEIYPAVLADCVVHQNIDSPLMFYRNMLVIV